MAEPFTIYKLTILNLLNKIDFPLTNTQVSDFFLEYNYTNYFHVQQNIGDLVDAGLILARSAHNRTQYSITDAGRETLKILRDKITDAIESDTVAYLSKNQEKLRLANSFFAEYQKTADGDYAVRCQLDDSSGKSLIDLTISVSKLPQAKAVCANWKKQKDAVYDYLMDLLMR